MTPSPPPPDLDDHALDNAVWQALASHHAELAEVSGRARRYPADVSVFGGVDRLDADGWSDLARLLGPSTGVALFRATIPEPPAGWTVHHRGRGHQMVLDEGALRPAPSLAVPPAVRRLTIDDVGEVLALVELTRPGPFADRTIEMGRYWGHVDADRRVLAMAGERLHLDGFTEISAVCTHPDARGRGLAGLLTHQVALAVLERGEVPFLHVAEGNDGARRVYERLGFRVRRDVEFAFLQAPPA